MELLNTRMFKWKKNIATGLGRYMDFILLNDKYFILQKPFNEIKTVFIHTRLRHRLIIYFIDKILPKLVNPVNVIIAGEDYTFPNNIDKRMRKVNYRIRDFKRLGLHKKVRKLFVENLDENIRNAFPIPLGINPKECPTNINYFLQFENINENKPLKFTNFNRMRNGKGQWRERGRVMKLCHTENWKKYFVNTGNINNHKSYLKELSNYSFTLCVHGGGLDVNPKLWESILLGVIPIIKENKPYTNIYKKLDFPVVIIQKWNENTINEENLKNWHKKYYNYFLDNTKRKNMLKALKLDFWINYVKN